MQNDITSPAYEESRETQGMKWLGRVIAIVIILAVALFGDVMYIVLMTSHFPTGPLLVLCYMGAITSFLGTIYLLIGKTSLFTPGRQSVFSWLVLFAELVIISLNIILVFHGQGNSQFLQAWDWIAPATPVANMFFVAILFFLDEEQHEKHANMELQLQQNKMDRQYKASVYRAKIDLQGKQLQYLSSELQKAVNSPESLSFIQQTALDMNAALLSNFAGRNYGAPRIIDADPPRPLAQGSFAQTDALPSVPKTSASNKPNIFNKVKDGIQAGIEAIRETSTPDGIDQQGTESEVKPAKPSPRPFHASSTATNAQQQQRVQSRRARRARRNAGQQGPTA